MSAKIEIAKEDLQALKRVARAADDLWSALDESEDLTIVGSDLEIQFTALTDALDALPEHHKSDWKSVGEDWQQDAPGG